jgi:hypothetical protein
MHGGKPKPVPVATPTADKAVLAKFLSAKPKPVPTDTKPKHTPVQSKIAPVPHNLDGHWDKRITRGSIVPDVSIDLHDASLSLAYNRLDGALEQAISQPANHARMTVQAVRAGARLPLLSATGWRLHAMHGIFPPSATPTRAMAALAHFTSC